MEWMAEHLWYYAKWMKRIIFFVVQRDFISHILANYKCEQMYSIKKGFGLRTTKK